MLKAPSQLRVVTYALFILMFPVSRSRAADPPELTPRQLFYKTREDPTSAPPQTPDPSKVASPENKTKPPDKPVPESSKKKAATQDAARATKSSGAAGKASDNDSMRLALRYAILQPDEKGELQEVEPGKMFHTKEHFRFKFQSKETAYLYVLIRQSQGSWKVLIPFKDMDQGDRTLIHGQVATIPSDRDLSFDSHPGTEELFVVLSKEPFQDLEHLMDSVRDRNQANSPVVASADVERLLNPLVSRGIDVESVTGGPADTGMGKENAVYVANVKSPAAPRLVVNVVLKHD